LPIRCAACRPGPLAYEAVMRLSRHVPATTLIEATARLDPIHQAVWMLCLRHWTACLPPRHRDDAVLFRWAARAVAQRIADMKRRRQMPVVRPDLGTIADFAVARRAAFKEQWSFSRALDETRSWHRELAGPGGADAYVRACGICPDDVIDYAPLPDRVCAGAYELIALRSRAELFAEGAAMRHCVLSYAGRMESGRSRIFSVRRQGEHVATLELTPEGACPQDWSVRQLAGPFNRPPPAQIVRAVQAALADVCSRLGLRINTSVEAAP
jgi:hypothetical protein